MSLDRDAIRARAEAATPGPWKATAYRVWVSGDDEKLPLAACWRPWGSVEGIKDDTAFIAGARSDVPDLLKALDKLAFEAWYGVYLCRDCAGRGQCARCVAALALLSELGYDEAMRDWAA